MIVGCVRLEYIGCGKDVTMAAAGLNRGHCQKKLWGSTCSALLFIVCNCSIACDVAVSD